MPCALAWESTVEPTMQAQDETRLIARCDGSNDAMLHCHHYSLHTICSHSRQSWLQRAWQISIHHCMSTRLYMYIKQTKSIKINDQDHTFIHSLLQPVGLWQALTRTSYMQRGKPNTTPFCLYEAHKIETHLSIQSRSTCKSSTCSRYSISVINKFSYDTIVQLFSWAHFHALYFRNKW